MRKTLLLLFASVAMVAGAQNKENCCLDSTNCNKECQYQWQKKGRNGRHNRMAFMKELSETDRAAVKELMQQYRKERKEIMEKIRVKKPAKGVKPTEKQMDDMIKTRYTCRMEVLKLQEKYYDKLRKTLKPMQAAALLNRDGQGFKQQNRPNCQNSVRAHQGNGRHRGHKA